MQNDFTKKIIYLNQVYFKNIDAMCNFFNITKRTYYLQLKNDLQKPSVHFINKIKDAYYNETDKRKIFNLLNITYSDFESTTSYDKFKDKLYLYKSQHARFIKCITRSFYFYYYDNGVLQKDNCTFKLERDKIIFKYKSIAAESILNYQEQLIINYKLKDSYLIYSLNLSIQQIETEIYFGEFLDFYMVGFLTYIKNDTHTSKKVILSPVEIQDNIKLKIILEQREMHFRDNYYELLTDEFVSKSKISRLEILGFLDTLGIAFYNRIIAYIDILKQVDKSIYYDFYLEENEVLHKLSRQIIKQKDYFQTDSIRSDFTLVKKLNTFNYYNCTMFNVLKDDNNLFFNNDYFNEYHMYIEKFKNHPSIQRIFSINNLLTLKNIFKSIKIHLKSNFKIYIYVSTTNFNSNELPYLEFVSVDDTFAKFIYNNTELKRKTYFTRDYNLVFDINHKIVDLISNNEKCFEIKNMNYVSFEEFQTFNQILFEKLEVIDKNNFKIENQ